MKYLPLTLAVGLPLAAFSQMWLSEALKDGTSWGPTRPWHVFLPMMMWFFVDIICVAWIGLVSTRRLRFRWTVALAAAGCTLGTYYAWSAVVGLLRVI